MMHRFPLFSFFSWGMFIAATMGSMHLLSAQNATPLHADYNLKYYFTHAEPTQKGKYLEPKHPLIKALENDFLQIGESDSFSIKVDHQWGYDTIRTVPDEFFVSAFLMQKKEVSNKDYLTFLKDTASPFFKEKGITFSWLAPDTNVWTNQVSYMEPYRTYYLRHPAYGTYPVVGVSQYQATTYCDWLEKKLNAQYAKMIPPGYKILVDLPTSAEFYTAAKFTIPPITEKQSNKEFHNNWSLTYALGWAHNELNYGSLKSNRLMDIKPTGTGFLTVSTEKKCSTPLINLFGNVAEWTSTRGTEKLKNNKEWIITTTGKIMKNPDVTVKESDLAGYLHRGEDLNNHFVVKGGSWNEEFHFMDPAVVQMKRGDYKSANIGFRTVIRIKKI